MSVVRLPEIWWGPMRLTDVGVVGVPAVSEDGPSLGAWYSHKTARPVDGFLGANAFNAYRVEIDYPNTAVYFEKGTESISHDMDLVGLTLRPEADGSYTIIGVPVREGQPVVPGIAAGDLLLRVDELETAGATFGTVMDALRGRPGESRVLGIERDGKRLVVEARVERVL